MMTNMMKQIRIMSITFILSDVRICGTLITNRAAARERKCPDVRICRTVHTNHEITKNKKWPHIRICKTFGTNRYSRDSGDLLMPPCWPQEWQNPLDCWSNFNHQKRKHAAQDDDEQDTSNDENANDMKNQWFDSAFCEDVLQVLDMIIPEPRFRSSADQFGLVGTMESAPPKARNEAS